LEQSERGTFFPRFKSREKDGFSSEIEHLNNLPKIAEFERRKKYFCNASNTQKNISNFKAKNNFTFSSFEKKNSTSSKSQINPSFVHKSCHAH